MKRKRVIWLVIVFLVIAVVLVVCVQMMHKDSLPNVTRSIEISTAGLFNRPNENYEDMKLNKTAASNQTRGPSEAQNLTHPKVCVEKWRQELISTEEALLCIGESKNSTK